MCCCHIGDPALPPPALNAVAEARQKHEARRGRAAQPPGSAGAGRLATATATVTAERGRRRARGALEDVVGRRSAVTRGCCAQALNALLVCSRRQCACGSSSMLHPPQLLVYHFSLPPPSLTHHRPPLPFPTLPAATNYHIHLLHPPHLALPRREGAYALTRARTAAARHGGPLGARCDRRAGAPPRAPSARPPPAAKHDGSSAAYARRSASSLRTASRRRTPSTPSTTRSSSSTSRATRGVRTPSTSSASESPPPRSSRWSCTHARAASQAITTSR